MKRLLPTHNELAWLLVRIGAGAGFLMHGIAKLQHMEGTVGFFGTLGFAPFFAWLVAITETAGGAMLILGLGMEIVGVLLAIIMLVVILKVKWSKGYSGMGGFELEAGYLAMVLAIALHSPGKWTLDHKLRGGKGGGTCPKCGQSPCVCDTTDARTTDAPAA